MSVAASAYVKHLGLCPNGERVTPAERALLWFLADDDTGWSCSEPTLRMADHVGVQPTELLELLASLVQKGVLYTVDLENKGDKAIPDVGYLFTTLELSQDRRPDEEIVEIRNVRYREHYYEEPEVAGEGADSDEVFTLTDKREQPELILDQDGVPVQGNDVTWFSGAIFDLFVKELGATGIFLYTILARGPSSPANLVQHLQATSMIEEQEFFKVLFKALKVGLVEEVPSANSKVHLFDYVVPTKRLLRQVREAPNSSSK